MSKQKDLRGIASLIASKGRGPDSMLVHMAPVEVKALQQMANAAGGSLSLHPETGLPEAGFLKSILPMVAGAATTAMGFGPIGATIAGGLAGAATSKNPLQGALMGGLGGYGGASLAGSMGLGATQLAAPVTDAAMAPITEAAAGLSPSSAAAFGPSAGGLSVPGMDSLLNPAIMGVGNMSAAAQPAMGMIPNSAAAQGILSQATNPAAAAAAGAAAGPQWDLATALRGGAQNMSTPAANPIAAGPAAPKQWWETTSDALYKDGKFTGLGNLALSGAGMYMKGQSQKAMADERRRSYEENSLLRKTLNAPAWKPSYAVGGGITGAYPNRPPEREVLADPLTGAEPGVDPFTGQQQSMAGGGIAGHPRYLQGDGDGMSDSIPAHIDGKQPAALATSEFVIPADVVSHLGNGSSEAGAKQLHAMMDRIRKARTGTPKQGKRITAEKFMPA